MSNDVELGRQEREPYAAIRATVRADAVGEAMGPLYGELFGWLGRKGAQPAGAPWSRYLCVGPDEIELEVGVSLVTEVSGEGRILGGVMPACECASIVHVGPYDRMTPTYEALFGWLAVKHRMASGAPLEVYLTDPGSEPDPGRWRTLIRVPVSPD